MSKYYASYFIVQVKIDGYQFFLPEIECGYSYMQIKDLPKLNDEYPPRMFLTQKAAKQAIQAWVRGRHIRTYEESFDIRGPEGHESLDVVRQIDREAVLYRIRKIYLMNGGTHPWKNYKSWFSEE